MQKPDQTGILDRLRLIEDMMAEGRRSTQRWGWMFLLWGIGPITAMLWEARGAQPALAWPVVVAVCIVVNGIVLRNRKTRGEARTTTMRSVSAIWASAGLTVLLLTAGAAWSHKLDLRSLYIAVFAVTGAAHSSSSAILRWIPQFLVAAVWWLATLVAFVLPAEHLLLLAAAALLVGNVGFGAWLTYSEWKHTDG